MLRGWDERDIPPLDGRVAVVTGANSGLGLAAATALAARGARVVLACRDEQRGRDACRQVAARACGPPPEVVTIDLADLADVRAGAASIAAAHSGIDLLVNNAGVMALPPMLTADGFDMQFGTNHLGHFALTGLLLPMLLARPAARVVTVSSVAARRSEVALDDLQNEVGYEPWVAYSRSKRANLFFAVELDRRARQHDVGLLSVAAHPGWSSTALVANGPGRFASPTSRVIYATANLFAQSAVRGARPLLYAGTAPGVAGGSYFGPRGPGQLQGAPRRVRLPRGIDREATAAGLWETSESLTGVSFNFG